MGFGGGCHKGGIAFPGNQSGNHENVAPMAITVKIYITSWEWIPSGEMYNNRKLFSWNSGLSGLVVVSLVGFPGFWGEMVRLWTATGGTAKGSS